jgi:molybdopterin-binding protein
MKSPAPNARNQFPGRVCAVVEAPVLSEVEVELAGGLVLGATISTREVDRMNLQVGRKVVAIVKANDVSLALA